MTEAILVALITGGMSLAGVIVTCMATARKTARKQEITQAVMETKLETLTREVRHHNNFAQRIPVVEYEIEAICRRLENLEQAQ